MRVAIMNRASFGRGVERINPLLANEPPAET
jgi:hypothetical protein